MTARDNTRKNLKQHCALQMIHDRFKLIAILKILARVIRNELKMLAAKSVLDFE